MSNIEKSDADIFRISRHTILDGRKEKMNLNMSKKKTATMTSAALTGMMVGAAVGMAAKSMMKPKKRKLAKSASKAIGAVGETMQNISSYLK